ncbi:MAG: acyltransferase family protein [Candidatus Nanopelagicales bacterium]
MAVQFAHQSSSLAARPIPRIPALDALRGVAVLAVFAYHLDWFWLPGGFLGVDLFFVLSGFLITTLLLAIPVERPLRIALTEFFTRRSRRLLPALLLLLITVSAWAAWFADPDHIAHLRAQSIGSLFSVANWVFIAEGVTYESAASDPSVLQHTWSLAIEEQFYLLWPFLIGMCVVRRVRARWVVLFTTLLAVGSAITMAMWAAAGEMNTAYLGTFSRIHEILIGCLGAFAVAHLSTRSRRRAAPAVPPRWLVTGGIVASAAVMAWAMATLTPTTTAYYRGGSIIFSIASLSLIVLLVLWRPPGGPLLRSRILRWVGGISYGLYLWHWPIIIWLTPASTPWSGLTLDAIRIAAAFALATGSFYLLELPIRRGGWEFLPINARAWWRALPVAVGLVLTSLLVSTGAAASQTQAATNDAVALPDHILGSQVGVNKVILVVGDSVPNELMSALADQADLRNIQLVPLAFGGCSAVGLFQVDDQGNAFSWSRRCTDVVDFQEQAIASYQPDIVVWYSNRERFGIRTDNGDVLLAGSEEHVSRVVAAIAETRDRLTSGGNELVIVEPVPKAEETAGACSINHEANGCSHDPDQLQSFAWLNATLRNVAAASNRVRIVTVNDALCPGGPPCATAERDGTVIRPDGVHIADEAEDWFAGVLLDRIM